MNKPRLQVEYESLRSSLKEELKLGNVMQVPKLQKIVINMGLGLATTQASILEGATRDLEIITGQKPVITRAKKSISGFKLREGQAVGAYVNVDRDRMWEIYGRLVALAIPRCRASRGLPKDSFDGNGNYTFGVTEQLIFPEIVYDKIDRVRGMDITFVTTAKTDEECRALLLKMGFPLKKDQA